MLERARSSFGIEALDGSCASLPLSRATLDCVLSSFVLSYLSDLDAFAAELHRVTRPGATVLLSDIHPETSHALHWKRSFRRHGQEIEIAAQRWPINQVSAAFLRHGFRLLTCIEPPFAAPEENIFAAAGRSSAFPAMQHVPAIYVLALVRESPSPAPTFCIKGARCALTSADAAFTNLLTNSAHIEQLDSRPQSHPTPTLDLAGYLLLPGLVNAHDHLEFALFPRLGHGPYANASQWAEDIHQRDAAVIALHRSIPRDARVWWGAIRNLLAGVTTVCHHNPLTPEMLDPAFPVTVVRDFQWAHSLAVNGDLTAKFQTGPREQPFILHAAEGVDARSAAEFQQLLDQGVVRENTVLVHGLALTPDAIAALNAAGASLILCPSSNAFLFHEVPSPAAASVKNLALGSDSPLTAAGDLLDELRFAHTHAAFTAEALYRMVTTAPAQILRLNQHEGRLTPGSPADFIATRDRGLSPADTLARISSQDIELVIRNGQVFLTSDTLYPRLSPTQRDGLELLLVDGHRRWIRAPLARLFHAAAPVMHGATLHLAGKKVTHAHAV
jgi:cytosine/adenosine deaminase-related metal-dependent hydrolase